MGISEKSISEKYAGVIVVISIICANMVGEILNYRAPWTITGSIGGIIQIIGTMSVPFIGMIIGRSLINDERGFKEYYKDIFIRYILPFGIYFLILKVLTLGQYKTVEITSNILGMFILAPFIKVLLKNLNDKKLKYLVGLIFIGSIINVYFDMFSIETTIDFSVFSSWLVFCIIGYVLPQIKNKKTVKNIYILGLVSAVVTFMVRTVPINTQLGGVSPTLILYSSAVFLFVMNFKWTCIHRFKVVSLPINFIDNHKAGLFFVHNFIIYNILYDKFNISANRFKVIFGSAVVIFATLILGGAIVALVDFIIIKNKDRLISWCRVLVRKMSDINSYKHYLIWFFSALVLAFFAEVAARNGIVQAIEFVKVEEHVRFIASFLLVLLVTSPCLLFKRMYFVFVLFAEGIITLAIASYIMLCFRGAPLTYSDFFSIEDGIGIAGNYIDVNMLVYIFVILLFIVFLNYKLAGIKVNRSFKTIKIPIIIILITFLSTNIFINSALEKGVLNPEGWDTKYSYEKNGFLFSLYDSAASYKKEKPNLYTASNLMEIKEEINAEASEKEIDNSNPNIIVVQLEAVMDPYTIEGIELSGDPLKNIRTVSDRSSSGNIKMPTFGGGTARSEFEVLTGMSLEYFSPGEVPHNTYLKRQSIESMAYVLDSEKYEKTLIHNFQGSFYGRNKAYENLGFDRYIPMEYMYNIDLQRSFPEDILIFDNVIETLEATEKRDFIFSIGVQTHGGYDNEYSNEGSEVLVTGDLEIEDLNQIQDYVDDLVEVDKMVGKLVNYVENLSEPTVLAVYSDHLPSLNTVSENFLGEERFLTPYFIYDNMGKEVINEDINSYELSTRIFDVIGISGGVMNNVHRKYKGTEEYEKMLECIQYDILNGKQYLYDEKNPHDKTELEMGIREIVINDVNIVDGNLEVIGQNFTEFSSIYVDGKSIKTQYVNETQLKGVLETHDINKVTVHQLSRYDKSIGCTEDYSIN